MWLHWLYVAVIVKVFDRGLIERESNTNLATDTEYPFPIMKIYEWPITYDATIKPNIFFHKAFTINELTIKLYLL